MNEQYIVKGGKVRRFFGGFMVGISGLMAFLSGFSFYDVEAPLIWAVGVIGLSLLITGLAKDVVAIAKDAIK